MRLIASETRSRADEALSGPLPAVFDRRFEAVVFAWDSTIAGSPISDVTRLRALIEQLCALGLDAAVVSARELDDVDPQLVARPQGPGRLHLLLGAGTEVFRVGEQGPELVEISPVDGSDGLRWIFRDLWLRGIGPGLVLVVAGELGGQVGGLPGRDLPLLGSAAPRTTVVSVGPEPAGVPAGVTHVGGGAALLLQVLQDQLERRLSGAVPELDVDPAWTLARETSDRKLERVEGALFTIADGRLGSSRTAPGSLPSVASVRAAGVYEGAGPETTLAPCPVWSSLGAAAGPEARLLRRLDLHTGLLEHELETDGGTIRTLAFSSITRPGSVALCALGSANGFTSSSPLVPAAGKPVEAGRVADRRWMIQGENGIAAAASQVVTRGLSSASRLDRLGFYSLDSCPPRTAADVLRGLAAIERTGLERLLAEHRAGWAARWQAADVAIESDDPGLQLAVRFALFHLMASVADTGEAAVGARGLGGPGYRGHVFWDADVFVLPFLAATHPPAARAMLEYRIRRLDAAREAARRLGRRGARFPWESARSGFDVTPAVARDWSGSLTPIRTGLLEEHIIADVAWAAGCYLDWTGDVAFAAGPGRELLVETARYWASRIRLDRDGRGHIYGVIGPDEYHEPVDDNAYTNVMARWNLRRAAQAARGSPDVGDAERSSWEAAADALVDNYDAATGLYEQFDGFFGLEDLVIADQHERPVAADLLLGRKVVRASQVVKQADVLMLHHLVPNEVAPGSLEPNLAYYESRTSHGSSLSPAVHASLLARDGQLDRALESLRLATRIDLDDLTGTTAQGIHIATMGGLWQALAFGFAGIRPAGDVLEVDPRLPAAWRVLELHVRFRGVPVTVRVDRESVEVTAASPVRVRAGRSSTGAGEPAAGTSFRFPLQAEKEEVRP